MASVTSVVKSGSKVGSSGFKLGGAVLGGAVLGAGGAAAAAICVFSLYNDLIDDDCSDSCAVIDDESDERDVDYLEEIYGEDIYRYEEESWWPELAVYLGGIVDHTLLPHYHQLVSLWLETYESDDDDDYFDHYETLEEMYGEDIYEQVEEGWWPELGVYLSTVDDTFGYYHQLGEWGTLDGVHETMPDYSSSAEWGTPIRFLIVTIDGEPALIDGNVAQFTVFHPFTEGGRWIQDGDDLLTVTFFRDGGHEDVIVVHAEDVEQGRVHRVEETGELIMDWRRECQDGECSY